MVTISSNSASDIDDVLDRTNGVAVAIHSDVFCGKQCNFPTNKSESYGSGSDTINTTPLKERQMFRFEISTDNDQRAKDESDFKEKFFNVFYFPLLFLTLGGFGIVPRKSVSPESFSALVSRQCEKMKHVIAMYLPVFYRMAIGAIHISNLGRIVAYCLTNVPKANESGVARYLVASIGMLYGTVIFFSEQVILRLYFSGFIESLASYQSSFGLLNDIGKRQRRLKCVTFVVMACDMFTAVGWDALGSEDSNDFVSFPLNDGHLSLTSRVLVHIMFCVFVFLVCIPIYGVLMFYTTILDTLRAEFRSTAKLISELLSQHDRITELQFDMCRQRYQSLCHIVAVFSQLTRGYVVVSFFFHMTSMFVSIFVLSSSAVSADIAKYQVFAGMAFNLLLILFLTAKWGLLHSAAHSVTQAVNNAPWDSKSKRLLQKMSLLMAQCSTNKVGINVFGLFIIDTSTPLMVTGTLITYGIVVLQFQLDKDALHKCHTNTTLLIISTRGCEPFYNRIIATRGLEPFYKRIIATRGCEPFYNRIIATRGFEPFYKRIISTRGCEPFYNRIIATRGFEPFYNIIIATRGCEPFYNRIIARKTKWRTTDGHHHCELYIGLQNQARA
ncbi:hypothetical protein Btru_074052 [Bulinus truncatus]|nr:hypothetical protein Btru_074052 [Bulinus truncatus]